MIIQFLLSWYVRNTTCMFTYDPELWNNHPHSMVAALLTTTTTRITTVLHSATVHTRAIPVWPVPLIRPSSTTTPPTPAPKRDTIGQATLDIHCICRVHCGSLCAQTFIPYAEIVLSWFCVQLFLARGEIHSRLQLDVARVQGGCFLCPVFNLYRSQGLLVILAKHALQ